jgi:hypothetical protein
MGSILFNQDRGKYRRVRHYKLEFMDSIFTFVY